LREKRKDGWPEPRILTKLGLVHCRGRSSKVVGLEVKGRCVDVLYCYVLIYWLFSAPYCYLIVFRPFLALSFGGSEVTGRLVACKSEWCRYSSFTRLQEGKTFLYF
jgi:hypothetical protein